VLADHLFEDVPNLGVPRSTIFFAALMVAARPRLCSLLKMNGLNSSRPSFGQAALVQLQVGPTTMTERPE
jgi:hypothetical protein